MFRSVLATLVLCAVAATALAAPQATSDAPSNDRSKAYYHFSVAHLYRQLAMQFVRQEYVDRAIEEYKLAMEADPDSEYIPQELIKLYASANRLDDAISLANEIIEKNPESASMYKLLGRIYQSYSRDGRNGVDPEMVRSAIEQYEQALKLAPEDSEVLLALGSLYGMSGRTEEAEKTLRKTLELEPNSAEAQSALAFLMLESGDADGAIALFEKVMTAEGGDRRYLRPLISAYEQGGRFADAAKLQQRLLDEAEQGGRNSLQIRRELAENLLRADKLDKALTNFKKLLVAEPRNPRYHLRVSQIHRSQRNYEDAWTSLREAQRLNPDDLDIKYNTVLLLEAEQRREEAIEALGQILSDTEQSDYEPRDAGNRAIFLEHLAALQRQEEDFSSARQTYAEIAELNPDLEPRVRSLVIDSYRAERDYSRALDESNGAVKEFPKSRPLLVQRATLLAETGDSEKAAELLEGLVDGGPGDLEIRLTIAQTWEKAKEYDKALAAVNQAEELAENKGQKISILFTKGSILERAKDFDGSEQAFRDLLEIDPENASALNYLGYMLADRGEKLDEAHDMVQRALDLDPDNGAYLDSLGWIYYRQEKFDLAERYLLRSLERFGYDPVVLTHLGDVYFELGDNAKAEKHWRLGLQEWRRSPKADRDRTEMDKLVQKLSNIGVKVSLADDGEPESAPRNE